MSRPETQITVTCSENAENALKCAAGNAEAAAQIKGKKRKISEKNAKNAKNAKIAKVDQSEETEPTITLKEYNAWHWTLRWANYPRNWQDFFNDRKSIIEKCCIGEEKCPTTGTPHLQGWIRLLRKNIARTYLHLPKEIHWETMRKNATERQNTVYCTKEWTNVLHWGIPELVPKFTRVLREPWAPWMKELYAILSRPLEQNDWDFRAIHWIWEPVGKKAKTIFMQAMYHLLDDVVMIEGKRSDVLHHILQYIEKKGRAPKVVFVNVPRSHQQFISYAAIEAAKDMFFMSSKYETGMVSEARPHVLCFSNDIPDMSKMSKDRWAIGEITELQTIRWTTNSKNIRKYGIPTEVPQPKEESGIQAAEELETENIVQEEEDGSEEHQQTSEVHS